MDLAVPGTPHGLLPLWPLVERERFYVEVTLGRKAAKSYFRPVLFTFFWQKKVDLAVCFGRSTPWPLERCFVLRSLGLEKRVGK